jgi:hypothetical protein
LGLLARFALAERLWYRVKALSMPRKQQLVPWHGLPLYKAH